MLIGYLDDGTRIHIAEYTDNMRGRLRCSHGHDIIAKQGEKVMHHFAHKAGSTCSCSKEMSEWHTYHQGRILPQYLEQRMIQNDKLHIADAKCHGVVIEYQHSPISKNTIIERETFYDNMIWVFDASNLSIEIVKRHKDLIKFRQTSGPRYCFDTNKPTFLDFTQRGYVEILKKKGSFIYGKYISFSDFDKRYLSGCLRDKCDKRIDRPKYDIV